MKTATLKIVDLKPAEYNPRVELRPGDQEYDALKNSLDKFGLAVPLIVNEKTGTLISGHQRLNVMKETGIEEAEAVLVDLDEDSEKLLNMSLNKIEGEWDYGKLEDILKDMPHDDIKYTGFSLDELQDLYDDIPEYESEMAGEQAEQAPTAAKSPQGSADDKKFSVFLSFPSRDAAKQWMNDRNIKEEFRYGSRNVTIRMEGSSYGKDD